MTSSSHDCAPPFPPHPPLPAAVPLASIACRRTGHRGLCRLVRDPMLDMHIICVATRASTTFRAPTSLRVSCLAWTSLGSRRN